MIEFRSENNIRQAWEKVRNWVLFPVDDTWKRRPNHYNELLYYEVNEFYKNEEKRIKFLSDLVLNDTFSPEPADMYYLPKSSIGLRPISIMSCDDLVYYQAIMNVIVEYFRDEFNLFEGKNIFGYIPAAFEDDVILKEWLPFWMQYETITQRNMEEGKIVGRSDITSFFTEISHNYLEVILREKIQRDDEQIIPSLLEGLKYWYLPHSGMPYNDTGKGIPQGFDQSNILSNIYLFTLDKALSRELQCIRYVDDFRIFSSSVEEVYKAYIILEKELRKIGLIKKDSKTEIDSKDIQNPFKLLEEDLKKKTSKDSGEMLHRTGIESEKTISETSPITSLNAPSLIDMLIDENLEKQLEEQAEEYFEESAINRIEEKQLEEHFEKQAEEYFEESAINRLEEKMLGKANKGIRRKKKE